MGTLDANEAVASVAYRLNEFFAIYPITPSSPMAEFADEWSAAGKKNLQKALARGSTAYFRALGQGPKKSVNHIR